MASPSQPLIDVEALGFTAAAFQGDLDTLSSLALVPSPPLALALALWNDGLHFGLFAQPQVLNKINDRRQTALYCASMQGHKPLVEFLLAQKACWNDRPQIVELLLKGGANPHVFNDHGELPYHNARSQAVKDVLAGFITPLPPKDIDLFDYLTEKAHVQNDSDAWYKLAILYDEGNGDRPKQDAKKAMHCYQQSAQLGHPEAQFVVGCEACERGDFKEAFDWFTKASDLDHQDAKYNLGLLYQRGQGAPKDFEKGVSLMKATIPMPTVAKRETEAKLHVSGLGISSSAGISTVSAPAASPLPKSERRKSIDKKEKALVNDGILLLVQPKEQSTTKIDLIEAPKELRIAFAESALLAQTVFRAADIHREYPADLKHENKAHLHALTCPPGYTPKGTIAFSRWSQAPLPEFVPAGAKIQVVVDLEFFEYLETPKGGDHPQVEWYLNFADHELFRYYGGPLFAQDELQVGEHPILASVREALVDLKQRDEKFNTRTVIIEGGAVKGVEVATPILLRGVERRAIISTEKNDAEERPLGLYGNEFAKAPKSAITKAVKLLDKETYTNFLAMVAPKFGRGAYTQEQVERILATAYTGFMALKIDSYAAVAEGESPYVIIHTGHWGTGAFGGNKVMMAFLQILAAKLAGIERIVYHAKTDASAVAEAIVRLDEICGKHKSDLPLSQVIKKLLKLDYTWGQGNFT